MPLLHITYAILKSDLEVEEEFQTQDTKWILKEENLQKPSPKISQQALFKTT